MKTIDEATREEIRKLHAELGQSAAKVDDAIRLLESLSGPLTPAQVLPMLKASAELQIVRLELTVLLG